MQTRHWFFAFGPEPLNDGGWRWNDILNIRYRSNHNFKDYFKS